MIAYSPPATVVVPAPVTVVRTVPAYRVFTPPVYYTPGISVRLRIGH